MARHNIHKWKNGCIVSTQLIEDGTGTWVALRIEGEGERMLVDIEVGVNEAVSIAHSLLSAVTSVDEVEE